MIAELRVRDLATIADVTLPLGAGLNVLTGETGAGKSMLVDALALLLGERAAGGSVRPGAAKAIVEGAFEGIEGATRRAVEALGLDVEDGRVVVRREVSLEGRSRAWVNGSPTTASVLAQLGAILVDLHGQHETQSLLRVRRAARHPRCLRRRRGGTRRPSPRRMRRSHGSAARRHHSPPGATRCAAGPTTCATSSREIDQARLKPGEEESLQIEARRLSQAGALAEQAGRIAELLEGDAGNALGALAQADRALASLEKSDPATAEWRELLDGAYANLTELARLASGYAQDVQEDPERLSEVEQRRDVIHRLCQKHGATIDAVLATRDAAAAELDLLDTADVDLRGLAARRTAAEAALRSAAESLTARRREAAERLVRGVNRLLPKLGLPGGKLLVVFEPLAGARGARTGRGALRRPAQRGHRGAAAGAGRVRRRAVPPHAGAQGGARAARRGGDDGVRRGGPGNRR